MFDSFHTATITQLHTIIKSSKPTSCALNPIPTSLLLEYHDDILPTLTHIINTSILSGQFPTNMKTAIVKPLLKKRHSLSIHFFADYIQFETPILSQHVHSAISSVEICISDVKYWMIENKLQLNNEKTECLLIRPNKSTQNLNCTSLSFGHNVISFSTTAKKIVFNLTDDMRIHAHVQDICRKVYIDIRHISSIRYLLSIDATKTLLSAFVLQKLDYCNSRFYGSPMYMVQRHQKVQSSAARLIVQCRKQNHISPLLMSLHWLSINARIEYILSVICHSFFLGLSPIYLSD